MQKIYLGPAGSPGKGTLEGIEAVKEMGLNAMEVEFVRGVKMGISLAKDVGEANKKTGLKLSIHCPYFINLASKEKIKIKESKKRILDSAERAHYIGADIVVFHPAYFGGQEKKKVEQMVLEACEEMSNFIQGKKWKVKLGLETTGKHSAFGSLDETLEICKKAKGCEPVLDFAHLFARNMGKIDYGNIFEKIEELKLKHIHTHFSNIKYSDKGEVHHLNMNASPVFEPLAKEILKRKIDITIISETPDTWESSLKMKKIFEKLGYRFE